MSFKLTDFITVTTSGDIGLSATPKSTNSNGTSMQINNAGLVWHWQGDGVDSMYISQNMYYDGVSWKRMISGYGSLMRLNGNTGDTLFYQTTTGDADSAISDWINPLSLKNNGSVGIGTTSTEGKLTLSYTAAELPSSGTTSNSAIQIISSLNNQLNIGLNTVSGEYGSFIQASDNNLAVPYPLHLQLNGGNVGIGITPYTQNLIASSLDLVGGAGVFGYDKRAYLSSNIVYNSGWKVKEAGYGAFILLGLSDGSFGFYNTTQGASAGDAVTETARLLISSTGKVGIGSGSNTLVYPLEVYGGNGDAVLFKDTTNSVTNWLGAFGGAAVVGALTDDDLALYAGTGEKMRISSTGNVGIGGTPQSNTGYTTVCINNATNGAILDLEQGDAMKARLIATSSTFAIETTGTIPINFQPGGSTALIITSTGAIAIGSSSTNYGSSGQVLTSNGNTAPSWTTPSGQKGEPGSTGAQGTQGTTGNTGTQGASGTNGGTGAQGTAGSTGGTGSQGTTGSSGGTGAQGATGSTGGSGGTGAQGTSGVATFPYSGTAVFSNQINLSNSDGYLYGGSITSRSGARAIHMGYADTSCIFQAERTNSSTSALLMQASAAETNVYSRAAGSSSSGAEFNILMGSTVRLQIALSGVVSGDFNDISDVLFKKNINFHGYGLVTINSLKPREFNWKESTRPQGKQIGFVAQEVEEIIPEVIHGYDGNKSISGIGLISVLTKAIQELSQEVTDLKAEVELLKQQ